MTVFNRPEVTKNCLENLLLNKLENVKLNIFISDASPNKKTHKILKQFNNIHHSFVSSKTYWNRGMLNSWEESLKVKSDFFLLLNDDTNLYINSIKDLLEDYKHLNSKSIVVGATKHLDKITYGGRDNLSKEIKTPNGEPQEIKYMNGNCVLIPYKAINDIGLLSKKFSHSLGDIEYGLRARKSNYKLFLSSKIIGNCENNNKPWYKIKPFKERYKQMKSPKGVPFKEYIYFNRKYFGLIAVIKFLIATFVALLFPLLFMKLKK